MFRILLLGHVRLPYPFGVLPEGDPNRKCNVHIVAYLTICVHCPRSAPVM